MQLIVENRKKKSSSIRKMLFLEHIYQAQVVSKWLLFLQFKFRKFFNDKIDCNLHVNITHMMKPKSFNHQFYLLWSISGRCPSWRRRLVLSMRY